MASSDQPGDIRLGSTWYSVAEGLDDPQLGFSFRRFPIARRWDSLFAERQNASGEPGIQNVRADDLRWLADDFSGGEGQLVLAPGDEEGARRYASATGIDALGHPGELRLARTVYQVGSTGGSPTTLEGNSFTNGSGSSTVVNTTDRRWDTPSTGRLDGATSSLATGGWQFDVYAYLDAAASITGGSMVEDIANCTFNSGRAQLKNVDARARTANRDPSPSGTTPVTLTYTTRITVKWLATYSVKLRFTVYNQTNTSIVTSKDVVLEAGPAATEGVDLAFEFTTEQSFNAVDGKNYRYRVQVISSTASAHGFTGSLFPEKVEVVSIAEDPQETKQIAWELWDASPAMVSSGSFTLTGRSSQRVLSTSIVVASSSVHTMRLTWAAGSTSKPILDSMIYQPVGLDEPYVTELGMNAKIWLADRNPSAVPSMFVWDQINQNWDAIGTFSTSGEYPIALAHSDNYEFVAVDKIVYRADESPAVAQYTAATTDEIVGIAVGGGRLWTLTVSVSSGLQLFEAPLEGTPNVAQTVRSTGMTLPLGQRPVIVLPQQIAGTGDGCVFFANVGSDCLVFRYIAAASGGTGSNLADGGLPRGFLGQAIVHGLGYTWLGGGYTLRHSEVASRDVHVPAIIVIDDQGNASQLPVELRREGEYARVQALQLYRDSLYALVETQIDTLGDGISSQMRLWEIELATNSAHLLHEIDTASGTWGTRALAVDDATKVMLWQHQAPFLERSTAYTLEGTLTSPRHSFGLTETKTLSEIAVTGEFPTGTSVEVLYAIDGGDFVSAGTLTASGGLSISSADAIVTFVDVAYQLVLRTSDDEVTPRLFQVGVRAFLNEYRRSWEVLLNCANETSNYHIEGQQLEGSIPSEAIFTMAAVGGVVEFEDRYTDPTAPVTYLVQLLNPEQIVTNRGESFVRVVLLER